MMDSSRFENKFIFIDFILDNLFHYVKLFAYMLF